MKAQIVSFHCVVKDKLGKILSKTFNRDVLTHDESQESPVLSGLAKGLTDVRSGEKRRIVVPAEHAFGYYDVKQVIQCTRSSLGTELFLGDKVQFENEPKKLFRVTEIMGDQVTLDANHPWAGQDLIFEVRITSARAATPEDLAPPPATKVGAPALLH